MMKTNALVLVAISISLMSCSSSNHNRKVASVGPHSPPQLNQHLLEAATTILSDVKDPAFDSAACVPYIHQLAAEVDVLQPSQLPVQELKDDALLIANQLFKVRSALHARLSEFSPECVVEVRGLMRIMRFSEDYLAEMKMGGAFVDPSTIDFFKQPVPMMDKADSYVLKLADGIDHVDFKTGDLMITRGISFLSAIIARIGDIQSQFSHVVFAHVRDSDQKVETIESYVGVGVQTYERDYALRNENVRILLLRAKDQDLAKRASDFMYAKVTAAVAAGHPIPYDYKLDFKDHSALSCAEVAEYAYEEASQGKVILPFYPSKISTDPTLVERLGMTPGATFTPGDMEVDPRFDMIAEWSDLRITRDSRIKDAILTQLLSWIEKYNYHVRDTTKSRLAGSVIWGARKTFLWPLVKKLTGAPEFSKQIPRQTFQTVALMNQIGDLFYAYLKEKDLEQEKATGWRMTYGDMYRSLDEFREKDFALYANPKTRKQSVFHFAFRPDKKRVKVMADALQSE